MMWLGWWLQHRVSLVLLLLVQICSMMLCLRRCWKRAWLFYSMDICLLWRTLGSSLSCRLQVLWLLLLVTLG